MVFSKKWLQNHPKFLLHFLIHIDVLMLCRKFELILTRNSRVMSILKFGQMRLTLVINAIFKRHIQRIKFSLFGSDLIHIPFKRERERENKRRENKRRENKRRENKRREREREKERERERKEGGRRRKRV